MTQGYDFYGCTNFPEGNLPNNDERIIPNWLMDHWNGGLGETVFGKEKCTFFRSSTGIGKPMKAKCG